MKNKIAIIGGSGLYKIDALDFIEEVSVETPYGKMSDRVILCNFEGNQVAFLPRHGRNHTLSPSEIPYKANIYGLKKLGFEIIISVSAVGSLKEKIKPMDFVIPKQIIDRTKQRGSSFFGDGIVGHVSFSHPFCEKLTNHFYKVIQNNQNMTVHKVHKVHKEEIYLCMEGPMFSSQAESHLYRDLKCGIIGMTAVPEAKLAKEAEMCYGIIAMTTDYDCWHEKEESVNVSLILKHMKTNIQHIKTSLLNILKNMPDLDGCDCRKSAKDSIMTPVKHIADSKKKELSILYEKYF